MENDVHNSYPVSCVRVCVDSTKNLQIHGRIYTPQVKQTTRFSGLDELLLKIDHIFDRRGYPPAYFRERTFATKCELQQEQLYTGFSDVEKNMVLIQAKKGRAWTFLLYVTSRFSGTWHGKLEWLDTGNVCFFQSELELIHLLMERIA